LRPSQQSDNRASKHSQKFRIVPGHLALLT
jgi:hypothetical protein